MSQQAKARREGRLRRHRRVRKKVQGTALRPRLAVHRSNRNISVQLIDDAAGVTIASASTLEAALRGDTSGTTQGAAAVGRTIAERARDQGITQVVFDRGGYLYHGRVAALADAARDAGLEF